jgi:group I intron endonuclease
MVSDCGVYAITNISTGKHYIGSAVNIQRRWKQHRNELTSGSHHSSKLQRSWNKYGPEKFEFSVILICAQADLLMYEQICMDFFKVVKNGYNILPSAGSNLGQKRTPEFKMKMSSIVRERSGHAHMHTPEARAKARAANIGKSKSLETRARMSMSASKNSNAQLHTKEAIAKRAASHVGGRRSSETKERMSIAAKAVWAKRRENKEDIHG